MSGPSATNTCRGFTRALLRVAGSTCLVSAIALAALTCGPYSTAQARAGVSAAPPPTLGAFFGTPVLVGTAGAWLLLLDAALLRRWLVPTARNGCPECGYDLRGLQGGVCPECGATLQTDSPVRS
ncbi:MAG: hypothetical protein ACREJO_09720 [Phycisphaerales bacterium]